MNGKSMGSLAERAVIHFVRSASNQDISLVRCAPDTAKLMRRHSVQTSNKAFSLPSIYHFSVSRKIYPFVPPRLTHSVNNVFMKFTVLSAVCRS